MKGYVTRKGSHWYGVVYDGLDPATGKERRRWHAAGTDRAAAEALAREFAQEELERRGTGRTPCSHTACDAPPENPETLVGGP